MKPPILYNRMESNILKSVIGNAGKENGTVIFQACKYGNGAYSNTSKANNCEFDLAASFNPNAYTVCWWMQTDYALVNGVPDDNIAHALWSMYRDGHETTEYIRMYVEPATGINYYDENNNVALINITFKNDNMDWVALTNTHFAWVKDRSGIDDGNDTLRMYINGVKVYNNTTAIAASSVEIDELITHAENYTGAQTGANPELMVDNLTLFDYAVTNYDWIHSERGALNDNVASMAI